MWLDQDNFRSVIASTPLISIDFVVRNKGKILLGARKNRPAKNFYFVPGGRVRKNERLDAAFERLTLDELGVSSRRSAAEFLGIYEHFYADSVFGDAPSHPSTHYIVMAYQLMFEDLSNISVDLNTAQHFQFQWWNLTEAVSSDLVHPYAKSYVSDVLRNFQ